jgi:hypothetical protein
MINSHPVEFELEGESSLADIVNSIATWTAERDLILSQVHVDEQAYDLGDLPEIDLSGVRNINCIVQSKADLVITTIDEGIRYCERALGYIDSLGGDAEAPSIEDLAAGMEWLAEVLLIVAQQAGLDREELRHGSETLASHVRRLREMKESVTAGGGPRESTAGLKANRETIVRSREFFGIILMSQEMRSLVMRSIDSPDMVVTQLSSIREGIDSEMANLEAAAVAFQTGKDREGAERLNAFIDFVYGYSRACYQVSPLFGVDLSAVAVEGESLEEKNARLRDLLDQITEIMQNNDIISLADTLEYEIKPSLENLGTYLDLLLSRIAGRQ